MGEAGKTKSIHCNCSLDISITGCQGRVSCAVTDFCFCITALTHPQVSVYFPHSPDPLPVNLVAVSGMLLLLFLLLKLFSEIISEN